MRTGNVLRLSRHSAVLRLVRCGSEEEIMLMQCSNTKSCDNLGVTLHHMIGAELVSVEDSSVRRDPFIINDLW